MHESFASTTTEVDVDPTLLMLGVAEPKAFVLELLPLQPSPLARAARVVLRWAPFAALGATGGLLLCIGTSALASAISTPTASNDDLRVASHFVDPAERAPAAYELAATPPQPEAVIELDEARAPDTLACRTHPAAVRPIARAVAASPPARPRLAAMPATYKSH